jgi:hypothetical protein
VTALHLALVLIAGCQPTVEGPEPSVASVDPSLVCDDQLTTTVTVRGSGFAPLPVDALDERAGLELPKLTLALVSDLAETPYFSCGVALAFNSPTTASAVGTSARTASRVAGDGTTKG